MKRAILLRFVAILMLALAVSSVFSYYFIGKNMLKNNRQSMINTAHVVDYALDYEGDLQEQLLRLHEATMDEQSRITIITEDGTVVADNEIEQPKSLENHLEREEVKEALKTGTVFIPLFGEPGQKYAVCGHLFRKRPLCDPYVRTLYQYAGLHDTDISAPASRHGDRFCNKRNNSRAVYQHHHHPPE